jgi:methylmalonyl-CoA/ethylmalonyl-CoA epimerase
MLKKMLPLPELGHVGIISADLEKCVRTFGQLFGNNELQIYDFIPKKVWVLGKAVSGCKLKIAMIKLPNGMAFEIIEALTGDDIPHKTFLAERGGGLHHIAFYTDQYDNWLGYFKHNNVAILFEAEAEDEIRGYRRCFYAEDKRLGLIVEFTEKLKQT